MLRKHHHIHQNNSNKFGLLHGLKLFNFIQSMYTKLGDLTDWGSGRKNCGVEANANVKCEHAFREMMGLLVFWRKAK